MKKKGIANFGQNIGNLLAGKLSNYEYKKKVPANWDLEEDRKWILKNVNILDVDKGKIHEQKAILINGRHFGRLLTQAEVETLSKKPEIAKVIDGGHMYLTPGMSDIHCHVSMIAEHGMTMSSLHYFDGQRMRNCEYVLEKGCTTVRNSAGAYDMVHDLKDEIDRGNLLGPRILPSYIALIPVGGMWDVGKTLNKMMEIMFGGQVLRFVKNDREIIDHFDEINAMGAQSFKIYMEEKPLFGKNEKDTFNMFSDEQLKLICAQAERYGTILETHAMFLKGARRAIRHGINSIAHLTVDGSYTKEDSEAMVSNNVAIVPTFGVGAYLAYNCGSEGYPDNEEYKYFSESLRRLAMHHIEEATLPQLRKAYKGLLEFTLEEKPNRKIPPLGKVFAERCHGFALHAPQSMENFRQIGTKIGMGTDGGTGLTFCGGLEIEMESLLRYGFSNKEIVRIATLGNMEIVKKDDELGSIAEGKLADMLLLKENPLENLFTMTEPVKVFKEGRCMIDKLEKERG
ncbi:MAG: amidohydrolase family protein [Spirochaetes bacterium]|nr:amidohydrolase family protein [Spirochaetota bacterium]